MIRAIQHQYISLPFYTSIPTSADTSTATTMQKLPRTIEHWSPYKMPNMLLTVTFPRKHHSIIPLNCSCH